MSNKSKIQWTMLTWNFLIGCTKKSAGCMFCYAIRVAWRLMHNPNPKIAKKFEGVVARDSAGNLNWTGRINFDEDTLALPLTLKAPRRIFVNSLSDFFHPNVRNEWIAAAFAVMMATPHHTYQILTKHPDRAARWLRDIDGIATQRGLSPRELIEEVGLNFVEACHLQSDVSEQWPLPNVQIITSVEDQTSAEERIPWLLRIAAAVRGVSAEPLIGPLNIERWLRPMVVGPCDELTDSMVDEGWSHPGGQGDHPSIDWVIVGGESGPGARPCALEWIRDVVEQCKTASVPVFVKQLGAFVVSESRTAPADAVYDESELQPFHYAPSGQVWAWRAGLASKSGGDVSEFPPELQVRQYPNTAEGRS